MAVDDDIEQPPQQEADAVLREVGVGVPSLQHRRRVQVSGLAHRDQVTLGCEHRELARHELAAVVVEMHVVQREEDMVVVVVQLRPLSLVQRVLHRERVQRELLGDERELPLGRLVHVHPDDGAVLFEEVGDARRVEVLVRAAAVPVDARTDHA